MAAQFLTNRKQCTQANGSVSNGHLLFLLYINDLSNILDNSKVSLYAEGYRNLSKP